jgi:hypothetical protein
MERVTSLTVVYTRVQHAFCAGHIGEHQLSKEQPEDSAGNFDNPTPDVKNTGIFRYFA